MVKAALSVPFRVLYPTFQTGPGEQQTVRAYMLKDEHGRPHHAYVVVWQQNPIGGYYDFFHAPKFNAGIDVRDVITHGNNAELKSFLVGARISTKFREKLKPYVQVSVGVGSSHAPDNSLNVSKAQYGVFVGADYALNRHVDWRVAEVGYGSVTTVSSDTVGGTASIPSDNVVSLSTGFVFHFR